MSPPSEKSRGGNRRPTEVEGRPVRTKRSTIRDVARAAGVSQGTVSRVINGLDVGAELKRRVNQAITDLHYQPSAIARSLRTLSTRTVGLVITDIANPVLAVIAKGAEEVLYPRGYTLIVGNTDRQPEREASVVKTLLERRVDGLLVTVEDEANRAVYEVLSHVTAPVVLIDRDLDLPFDRVHVDHAKGVKMATEYLLSLGHRRIALITADRACFPGRDRVRGYEAAFRDANMEVAPHLIRSHSLSAEYGFREASFLLSGKEPPTAIIAGGNQILEGVLEAIRSRGLSIPSQVSVVACDDTPLTRLGTPPITVVHRDLMLLGRLAADMLVDRLTGSAGTESARAAILPTSLVLRESCAPIR